MPLLLAARACRSPQANTNASAAARTASLFPIERKPARLTTVSSESLASAAEFHRVTSRVSEDRAAATVPNPKTRSLIPMVLMSKREAAVGCSTPDQRRGAPGATKRAKPTEVRSQPIASLLTVLTAAAYRTTRASGVRLGLQAKLEDEMIGGGKIE
jgi:hypothetical protein